VKKKAKAAPSPTSAASSWEDYVLPGVDLLEEHSLEARTATDPSELQEVQQILIETLAQFGIAVGRATSPRVHHHAYEVYPAKGVRVDKIVSLERDLARATSAERINILAPIPGQRHRRN
jgi:DNA segregation ATPase FtsK/SpoIIIE and related proteins